MRHEWIPGWDDKSNSSIEKCIKCGFKRRSKIFGIQRKGRTAREYYIDGQWTLNYKTVECKQITKDI